MMVVREKILVRDALMRYRSTVTILKKGFSQENFRIAALSRSWLGDMYLHEVTSVEISKYRDERLSSINVRTKKPLSSSTVRLELSLLSHLFDVGRIEWGACTENPVKFVRKPKLPPGRSRRLSAREERKIMRYAAAHKNPELLAILIIAVETAMRQGEILSLTWENIDLVGRIAHLPITKNGERRDVPLSLKARDALISVGVKQEGAVFTYTASGLKSTWRFMLEKEGIEDLHFHDLRHEAVSRLFELGTLDSMEVSAISGHKSLSMLKRYTHLKAKKLVSKLEGGRGRAKQAVINQMVPYPAIIEPLDGHVRVGFLDLPDVCVVGWDESSAIEKAEDALMRRLLLAIREGKPIPRPDQYLDSLSNSCHVVMVDPLASRA